MSSSTLLFESREALSSSSELLYKLAESRGAIQGGDSRGVEVVSDLFSATNILGILYSSDANGREQRNSWYLRDRSSWYQLINKALPIDNNSRIGLCEGHWRPMLMLSLEQRSAGIGYLY